MNIQRLFLGIVVTVLLASSFSAVASSFAAPINETDTNVTTDSYSNNTITTLITSFITSNTQTTAPITTAFVTSDQPITTAALSTASSTAYFTSGATAPFTTSSSTSTKGVSTTTKSSSGRKFDGFSFIGGMILAGGLGGIIFLIVSYLRRHNRLPYYNIG